MEQPTSRIEQLNQAVRAVVVIIMTLGFIYGFIISKVVSTESFGMAFLTVLTWWFASRDRKQDADATKTNGTPPTPGGVTS